MNKDNLASFSTDPASALRISDALADAFGDCAAVATYENAESAWTVSIHFDTTLEETALRDTLRQIAGDDVAAALRFEHLGMVDWVKASLSGLTPVTAGRFVVHGSHDRGRIRPNALAIEIEAALAFGTGHHGTTRGCLLALDEIMKRASGKRLRVLDIGTGSGVLAFAAAKALRNRLRGRVLASDIDPVAVHAARANAALNHVSALVEAVHAADLAAGLFRQRGPFDLVFANILLPPLLRLATPISHLIAPGAYVVLSGLLREQAQTAIAAYRARGLVLQRRRALAGWATLTLRRP